MRSFIPWVGGKSKLAKQIVEMMPEHKTYVEPFGGAGWVLFKKPPEVSKCEVYNDIDSSLVNLFKVVRSRPRAFLRWHELQIYSRQLYNEFWERYQKGQWRSDVERAAMFYHIIKSAFGSLPGKQWRRKKGSAPQYLPNREIIMKIHARLTRVHIEHLDFESLIEGWDKEDTLFYCDPPYTVTLKPGNNLYHCAFTMEDHHRLAEILRGIKGMFILSYDDSPLIRELYGGFRFHEVELRYTFNMALASRKKKMREVIITNFG